jgi:hypothetical protein
MLFPSTARPFASATVKVICVLLLARTASADECSIAKTNQSCTLTIDRTSPLTPPTIQMYPGQTLTVVVKNPYYFERYFMDYSSGQLALAPDVASSIVGGLLPSLSNFSQFHALLLKQHPGVAAPPQADCSVESISKTIPSQVSDITASVDSIYTSCLNQFADNARKIYLKLEPAVVPDAHPQGANLAIPDQAALNRIALDISKLYDQEVQLSNAIGSAASLDKINSGLSSDQVNSVRNWVAASALADSVAKDLYSFSSRIDDLSANPIVGRVGCGLSTCVNLYSIGDPPVNAAKMVTRQVTYAIDALNMVQTSQIGIPDSSKKQTIASVTVFYGDSRWELSAGTLFSTLADRSFSIAPILANATVANLQVSESILHPTVVPFAAANYRISDDLGRLRWRSAVYWTLAVGINPNTVSTDFATGPSISYRGLMFSALWHVGHDVRLTQGLYKNQILDPGYSGSATTQSYWRLDRIAIGISVRVPSLTGR